MGREPRQLAIQGNKKCLIYLLQYNLPLPKGEIVVMPLQPSSVL